MRNDSSGAVCVWLEDVETRRGLEGEAQVLKQAQFDL
jgi:hypothetical protein